MKRICKTLNDGEMMKNNSLVFISMLVTPFMVNAQHHHTAVKNQSKPNIIIILTDDQGYQDLGCYGSPLIHTPSIDKMASEGLRLTDFYVSASVSSASRAGLLTGKMNDKNGVKGVLLPDSKGLPSEEVTLAEALKEHNYATGCFGKWHLGDLEGHLPTEQGFDQYFGIPYSNDMYIGYSHQFADNVCFRNGYTLSRAIADQKYVKETRNKAEVKKKLDFASPLFMQDKIVEYPCDQSTTTRRYFDKAIEFIEKCNDKPFFAYITPSMPHVPLFVSEEFRGKSKRGLYGDAVEEIDWNVGRLLDFLDQKGLSANTLVIFSSDNGPWLGYKEDAGSADPLRDGKFSHYEGGVRVPCIVRWKGKIPANVVSDAIISSIDFFPTIMHYVDSLECKQDIDGINISGFLDNPSLRIRDHYIYVKNGNVHGVRKGDWIYLPYTGKRNPSKNENQELFNINRDIGQMDNVYDKYSEKIKELQNIMRKYQWNGTLLIE